MNKLLFAAIAALLLFVGHAQAQATDRVCDYEQDGIYHCKYLAGRVTTQAGTTYTLSPRDCGTQINFTNTAAITVTIPASLPVGCNMTILQAGAGTVTVTGSAVTAAVLHSAHTYTGTFGQWAMIGLTIEANSTGRSAIAVLTGDGA